MKNMLAIRASRSRAFSVLLGLSMLLAMLGGNATRAASAGLSAASRLPQAGVNAENPNIALTYFHVSRQGDRLLMDWSTGRETGMVGFNLYMQAENRRQKLNDGLIPSTGLSTHIPQDYAFDSSAAGFSGLVTFLLETVDILGRTQQYGPFEPDRVYGKHMNVTLTDWQKIKDQAASLPAAADAANRQAVNAALQERLNMPVALRTSSSPAAAPGTSTYSLYLPLVMQRAAPGAAVRIGDLLVSQTGLQRVSYADLLAAGLNLGGQPASDVALVLNGQPVPISVTGPGTFGPGSSIEFYGQALDTFYTNTNVYTLWLDPAAARRVGMDLTAPDPTATPVAYYMETALVDNNTAYNELSTSGDPWYDTYMLAYNTSKSWDYPIRVDHYLAGLAPASLQVKLYGGTDYAGSPDHHVVTSFNGTQVANQTFDALNTYMVNSDLGGLLREGSNTLNIQLPGDTGKLADVVYMDQYRVTYPRSFRAVDGSLKFEGSGSVFQVDNLVDSSVVVYRLQNGNLTRLDGSTVTVQGSTYRVRFIGSSQAATYYVAGSSAVRKPGIRAAHAHADLTSGTAQYLVIAHPDFISGLAALVQARTAQGLTVRVVDVNDIYDQYSYGILDPQAIKSYISYAARNMGTQVVLLVGDDTYDYKDYLKLGSLSFIPSIYMAVGDMVQFTPVDPKYADLNDDNIPDLAIGRFAVRTPAELGHLISKTLAYAAKSYPRTGIFTADWNFSPTSNGLVAKLPSGWTITKAYLDSIPVTEAHDRLMASLNAGVALTSFVGHSDDWEWTYDGLFDTSDAPKLTNTGRPTLITQQGCWTNYYINPLYETLQDTMLNNGMQGAAGMFGATTLTFAADEQAYGLLFMPLLTQPGLRIGQAELQAKQAYAAVNPSALDVLLGTSLLGDPALLVTP